MNESNSTKTPKRMWFYLAIAGIMIGLIVFKYVNDGEVSLRHLLVPGSLIFAAVGMRSQKKEQGQVMAAPAVPHNRPVAVHVVPAEQPLLAKILFFVVYLGGGLGIPFGVCLLLLQLGIMDNRPGGSDAWMLWLIPACIVSFVVCYLAWTAIARRLYGADTVRSWVGASKSEYNPVIQNLETRFQKFVDRILG